MTPLSLLGLCGLSWRSSWPRMKTTATPSFGKWWKTSNKQKTPRPLTIPKPTRYKLHLQLHAQWIFKCTYRTYSPCWQTFCVFSAQKLYTVCDVAMHIIMSKSTTYSLESPKDPVLPSSFFTKPDKVGVCCKAFPEHLVKLFLLCVTLAITELKIKWTKHFLGFCQCFRVYPVTK